jgi:hypothetical protein
MFYSKCAKEQPPQKITRKIGVDQRTRFGVPQVQTSFEFFGLDFVNQSRNNVFPVQISNIKESPEVCTELLPIKLSILKLRTSRPLNLLGLKKEPGPEHLELETSKILELNLGTGD